MKLLRKVSAKTVCGKIKRPEEGQEIPLFRLMGSTDGVKTGESAYGPWFAFTGSFLAIRADGEEFGGSLAFIPEPVQGMIIGAIDNLAAGERVDFVVDVGLKHAENSVGYEYTTEFVQEPEESNPYRALAQRFKASLPAPIPAEDAPAENGSKRRGRAA